MIVLEGAGRKFDRQHRPRLVGGKPRGIPLDEDTLTVGGHHASLFDCRSRSRQATQELTPVGNPGRRLIPLGNFEIQHGGVLDGFFDFPMIDNTRLGERPAMFRGGEFI